MKNSKFLKFSILGLLPVMLAFGVISPWSEKQPVQVGAYTKTGKLNTGTESNPIYLSDSSDEEIRNYYQNLNSLSQSELKSTNLLKNLKPILKNNQKYFKYDGDIWKLYEIADRDWKLSPESTLIGDYDPVTKTLIGYQYGKSDVYNPYLHALYQNRDVPNNKLAWGSHGDRSNAATIEREHVWPKNHGFDGGEDAGARGDPMHLIAADGTANGEHSNLFYGYVDQSEAYTDCGTKHSNVKGNLTGKSKTLGTGKVFEPQDCDKGDIARSVFYMVARYNNYAGKTEDQETFDNGNPNLRLINDTFEEGGQSTATSPRSLGIVSDLLEWNRTDPVDDYEIHRNNILFKNYTNNRNPFIDFPEWADIIWGTASGYANPQSDEINKGYGTGGDTPVDSNFEKATAISVGNKVCFVTEKYSKEMLASQSGYFSGGEYVAVTGALTFDVVAGSTSGTYAFKNDNNYLAWSTSNDGKSLIYSTTLNQYSSWNVSFSSGNALIKSAVNDSFRIQWNNSNNGRFCCYSSNQTPIQIYKEKATPVTSITLNTSSVSLKTGDEVNLTANILPKNATNKNVIWTSSKPNVASVSDGKVVALTAGSTVITATTEDGNKKATCNVSVTQAPQLVSLTISGVKDVCGLNEEFETDGISVVANYNNGDSEDVTSNAIIGDIDTTSTGAKSITISYKNLSETFDVIVVNDAFRLDSTLGLENGVAVSAQNSNDLSLSFDKNGNQNAPKYYTTGYAVRFYGSNQFTLTSIHKISKIVFKFGTDDGSNAITASTGSFTDGVWSGSSKSVTFTIGGTTGHRKINAIYVMYEGNWAIDSLTIIPPSKNEYQVSEKFDATGLEVIANYKDGVTKDLSDTDFSLSEFDSSSVGTKTINVVYEEYGKTVTGSFTVTVENQEIKSITLSNINKVTFEYGEEFSFGDLVVTVNYNIGPSEVVTSGYTQSGYSKTTPGEQTITINYQGVTATYQITVKDPVLTSISVNPNGQTLFKYGEEFSHSDVVVSAHYSDNSTKEVDASFSGYNMTSISTQTITVTYTEKGVTKTTTYQITVNDYNVSITLSGSYKTQYKYGEELSKTNMAIKLNTKSGASSNVAVSDCTFSGYNKNQLGNQTVTVTYNKNNDFLTTTYDVTVVDYIKELKVECISEEYEQGTEFVPEEELTITAIYAGPTEDKIIDVNNCEISSVDTSVLGEVEVTVTYQGVEGKITVNVVEPEYVPGLLDMFGCGGNVVASTGLISLASLLGAGFILFKKKRD